MTKKLEINGYKIPGARGSMALWKALYNVLNNPGISQQHQSADCASFSGLNQSTMMWLTSPGPRSPAEILWDRRKEGTFRLYPNEWTQKALDIVPHPNDTLTAEMKKRIANKRFLPGDRLHQDLGWSRPEGRDVLFVNYIAADAGKYDNGGLIPNSERQNFFERYEDIRTTVELVPYNPNPSAPVYSMQQHLKAQVFVDEKFEIVWLSSLS